MRMVTGEKDMERKLIFFDIDGTLTSAHRFGHVYESTCKALAMLKENGHFLALATGRAAFRARQFQQEINIPNMVCEGGNEIIIDGRSVSYELPDQQVFHTIYEAAMKRGVGVAIAPDDSFYRVSPNDRFHAYAGDFSRFMEVRVDPSLRIEAIPAIRRLFLSGEQAVLQEIIASCPLQGIGVMHYERDQFIILEPDDKYKGIRRMVELLGEDERQVVVFGDGLNDRQMFRDAPFAIAMGNAIPQLKELADYVCPSADEDGIYRACQHFGWI